MDKTEFGKNWANFWYYHKWHVVMVIFLLLFAISVITSLLSRVNPDLNVIVITSSKMSTSEQGAFQKELQSLTADTNNDGKKIVLCEYMDLSDSNGLQSAMTKLALYFHSDDKFLFLFDDASFKTLFNDYSTFSKITEIFPDMKLDNQYKLPIKNTTLSKFTTYNDLSISVRSFSMSKRGSETSAINNGINILKKITQ